MVNNNQLSRYNIDGLKFFNKDRSSIRGGSVALYVATWVNPVQISPCETYVDQVCMKIKENPITRSLPDQRDKSTNMTPKCSVSCNEHFETVSPSF